MSESKFLKIQKDICAKPPEPPKPDRICATCVPNSSFIPPNWWEEPDPWLNEKTCEYSVAVTVSEDGSVFTLSDLQNSFSTMSKIMEDLNLQVGSGGVSTDKLDGSGVFELIKRGYIRPGIRKLLRHYGKVQDDTIICSTINVQQHGTPLSDFATVVVAIAGIGALSAGAALASPAALAMGGLIGTAAIIDALSPKDMKKTCDDVDPNIASQIAAYGSDLLDEVGLIFGAEQVAACSNLVNINIDAFIKVRNQLTSFHSSDQYKTYSIEEKVKEKFCEIQNLNAVELYARASDYHFHGVADNAMSVLITIPAHIFDQIPEQPKFEEVDTNIPSIKFNVSDFTTYISQIKKTFSVFSKYQSAFYHNEQGQMIQKKTKVSYSKESDVQEISEVEVPFYLSVYVDRFEEFESALALFLDSKGYGYPGGDVFSQARGMMGLSNDIVEIELFFDKTDELKPFKLTDTIKVKPNACKWIELTLPPEPEGVGDSLSKNIRTIAYRDQTLMGYIANYNNIRDRINARETPPWLDFVVDTTYPPLDVNFGTSALFSEKSAVNCLAEKFSGLSDFILNESLSFTEAFQYQLNKNNCKLMKNLYNDEPVLFDGKKEGEKFKKAKEEQRRKKLKQEDSLVKELKNAKKKSAGGKTPDPLYRKIINQINPCNWKKVTMMAIKCLLSEMTVEDGYRAIIKSTLGSISTAGLQTIIESLPLDKQQEIRAEVEKSFKDMPAPWESGWESGDLGAAVDREAMDRISENALPLESIEETYKSIEKKIEELKEKIKYYSEPMNIEAEVIKRGKSPPELELEEYKTAVSAWQALLTVLIETTAQRNKAKNQRDGYARDMVNTDAEIENLQALIEEYKDIHGPEGHYSGVPYWNQDIRDMDKKVLDLRQEMADYDMHRYNWNLEYEKFSVMWQEQKVSSDQASGDVTRLEKSLAEMGFVMQPENQVRIYWFEGDIKVINEGVAGYEKRLENWMTHEKALAAIAGVEIQGIDTTDPEEKIRQMVADGRLKTKLYNDPSGSEFPQVSYDVIESMVKLEFEGELAIAETLLKEAEAVRDGLSSQQTKTFQKNPDYALWESYTEEEKAKAIEREKQKVTLVSLNEGDKIKQGTLGRALGNVQKAVMAAYVDSIMKSADVRELMNAIDKLPGSKIIGSFVATFDCPRDSMIYPPIDSFLNTLTTDPCGPGQTRFALPWLKKFPQRWNIFAGVGDAFLYAMKKTFSNVLQTLLLKKASLLEKTACRGIEATKKITLNAWRGDDPGLNELIDKAICKDLDEKDKDKAAMNLFNSAGVPQNSPASARELLDTMSVLGSENDFKKAMLSKSGDQDSNFLDNLARTVSAVHPEYAPYIGTGQQMGQFLQQAGGFLTPEQQNVILDEIDSPTEDFPLESSICLTKEEADQYYSDLTDFYSGYVGPEIAEEFVNKQKDRVKSDLGDLVEALAKGPEEIFQDAIDKALAPPDPDCPNNQSVVKIPERIQNATNMLSGLFIPLQKAFMDDTMEENFLESAFGMDSVGVLLTILSNSVGYNLAKHKRIRNNIIFRALAWVGVFDASALYPETIAGYMRDYMIEDLDGEYKNGFIRWNFKDNVTDEDGNFIGFTSTQQLIDNYKIPHEVGSIYHNDFNYAFYQWTPEYAINNPDNGSAIIVERKITPEERQELDEIAPTPDELLASSHGLNTYKNLIFKKILEDSWPINMAVNLESVNTIMDGINRSLLDDFKNSILKDEFGGVPQGFLHGGNNGVITLDDLTYVNPEEGATEYTFPEESKVLGRSMTNNPRVKFLNPEKYGGTYEAPNIYIDPIDATGWMRMTRLIVPNIAGCDPAQSNFLRLEELEKLASERGNQIEKKEELSKSPDCIVEVPFDKISSPATLGALEASVYATIRVYLAEFFILSMPIHSSIRLGEDNYDELLAEFIVARMKESMSKDGGWFVSTYEKYTYWLLFLEQVVQAYDRKVKLGEIEADEEAAAILEELQSIQQSYNQPSFDTINAIRFGTHDGEGYDFGFDPVQVSFYESVNGIDDFVSKMSTEFGTLGAEMMAGVWIVGNNSTGWNIDLNREIADNLGPDEELPYTIGGINTLFLTLSMARLGTKITTLVRAEERCKKLLNRLVMDQIKYYGEIIKKEMSPRPHAYDLFKFFVGASKTTLGNTCRAGLYDVEVPVGEGNEPRELPPEEYGTINHCSSDGFKHPLQQYLLENPGQFSVIEKQLRESNNGAFYLEKYLRITERYNREAASEDSRVVGNKTDPLPDKPSIATPIVAAPIEWIKNRPKNLKNVVNIKEFQKFLVENKEKIDPSANISDYFGNALLSADPEEEEAYSGSIGIKFGVRINYIPPKDSFNPFSEKPDLDEIRKMREMAEQEMSFISDPMTGVGFEHTQYSLPLVSYEQDINDVKLIDLIESDDNFNENLKCYIDKLVEQPKFKIIFDKIFNMKRIPSFMACYSAANFMPSLGLGVDERRPPELGWLIGPFTDEDDTIPGPPTAEDRGNLFNDCKTQARRIFISVYKRSEFDPDEEGGNFDLAAIMKKLMAQSYNAFELDEAIPWWYRKRIINGKSNPVDKDGNECKNQFAKLFDSKK